MATNKVTIQKLIIQEEPKNPIKLDDAVTMELFFHEQEDEKRITIDFYPVDDRIYHPIEIGFDTIVELRDFLNELIGS